MAEVEKLVYTLPEVCTMLDRSDYFIRARIKSGVIKAVKIGGKYAIPKEEIERILRDGIE